MVARPVAIGIVICMFSLSLGCSDNGFPTSKTIGVVKCKGEPVAGAMVYFEPITGGENSIVGRQGFSFTDAEGKFEISTYTPNGKDGAVVGKHRVRVGRGEAKCDCAMNDEVDVMQVEVKAGQTNEFTLDLKVATVADKRQEQMMSDEEDDEE
jgi:hypothetical protein